MVNLMSYLRDFVATPSTNYEIIKNGKSIIAAFQAHNYVQQKKIYIQ